jgi:hypothetical protein
MAHILFLDNRDPFDGAALRERALGGIETATVELAEAFARRGHRVTVLNARDDTVDYEGVRWGPLPSPGGRLPEGDVAIVNNQLPLLAQVRAPCRVVWYHNRTSLSRVVRKKEAWPLLRLRPHAVLLSQDQLGRTPALLPFASRRILHHGLSEAYLGTPERTEVPRRNALFFSQPYRGLEWLAELWRARIHPACPEAEFHVFAPKAHQTNDWLAPFEAAGIRRRGSVSKAELREAMADARVLLIPGHKDETFCLAATEATASGLPLVTRGIGALAERVRDGETGFLAPEPDVFAARTLDLLTDDGLWRRQHRAALADPGLRTWDAAAAEWEAAFLPQIRRSSKSGDA